jgi:hypothetical protein
MVLAEIAKIQKAMWRGQVLPEVVEGLDDAVDAAEDAIETMTRVAYVALPEAAAEALIRGLRASVASGLASDRARKRRELSTNVYRLEALHTGKVEDIIRQGLISNLSAKELAQDAYKDVSSSTPGGASYAAMRLARTEINNAFHERQLQGAERPGVTGVKWNLSGSHKVPDECNTYADTDKFKKGIGVFPVGQVPDKPHPQCFCYLTYIMMAPGEMAKAFQRGDFDSEIDRRTKETLARLAKR